LQHQILRKARGLLGDKRNCTRYASARTGSGAICPPHASEAVKFCAYGAIARAALEITDNRHQAREFARSIEMLLIGGGRTPHPQKRLSHINDHKGYAAVLRLFDAAVEDCAGFAKLRSTLQDENDDPGPRRKALRPRAG
jgi:hypothetical protein